LIGFTRGGGLQLGLFALLAAHAPAATAQTSWMEAAAYAEVAGRLGPVALADWIVASGDTQGRPFIIVDKPSARVLAFDSTGRSVGETAALIGVAISDDSPPGIGSMRLAEITPALRVTPAGRYEAHLGENLAGNRILWVDYEAALSLHPVATGNASERRLERLATSSVADNRITYGCINVPVRFYEDVIEPLFAPDNGIVFILPED